MRSDLPLCRVFPPTHPAPQDYLWILVHIVGKEDEKWERVDHRRWRKTLVKYHASLPEAPSYDVYRDSSKKQKTGDGTGDGDGEVFGGDAAGPFVHGVMEEEDSAFYCFDGTR